MRLEEVYIDNGFTGTNFERPGFMRLIGSLRSGKVQCIVVKDLSSTAETIWKQDITWRLYCQS